MPFNADAAPPRRSYAHAHWYFLAAFAVVVAGVLILPSFRPMEVGRPWRTIHSTTGSLWYVALMAQSWLGSRGLVVSYGRIARGVIPVLLPVLCISTLVNTRLMLTTSSIFPPVARPIIALGDFHLVAQMIVLTCLGLRNRNTPAAHERYMAATAVVGLQPSLGAIYHRLGVHLPFVVGDTGPLQVGLTIALILIVLMVIDRRMGERRTAYPLLLAWTVFMQLSIGPMAFSGWWQAFCRWFAAAA